jgi:phenylacetate-coenzyme A ligase PaaK-like adenylate-forming protein
MNARHLLLEPPFSLKDEEKQPRLLRELCGLTGHHLNACEGYRRIVSAMGLVHENFSSLEDLPFLPVSLFKRLILRSVPEESVVRELNSSGTSRDIPSRIFLDRETALNQAKALVNIVTPLLGSRRRPMLIIDSREQILGPLRNSARAAGVLGFSTFGREHRYLLDERGEVNWSGFEQFYERFSEEEVFIMGFTFMVWRHFVKEAIKRGSAYHFKNAVLLHGGGWKKLEEESVSAAQFSASLSQYFGISCVRNYYGMVEQVGSIFIECSSGYLHAPSYAEIIVRDPRSLEPLPMGERGLIQCFSILPRSYPGHSILTEDLGTVLGVDTCSCGMCGTYFQVHGRLQAAPRRGCSDVYF